MSNDFNFEKFEDLTALSKFSRKQTISLYKFPKK